ncbi:MAG: N-acetylmannosamine-6-phosphate 2-epimerase [Armatimonadetes bacterium]|nr:N-acetylmannosamine-6-phosphate 2-epimerase [Armatimonadota bacterium]
MNTNRLPQVCRALEGGLIVSCQARPESPLHGPTFMAAMARAAEIGGAVGLRVNGPNDIRAVRRVSRLPIIGILKEYHKDFPVYITPTFRAAAAVVEAGAHIVALDATPRPRPGETIDVLIRRVREELRVPVMADIVTLEEGVRAAEMGADLVATTLSGHAGGGPPPEGPDIDLAARLAAAVATPVIAEGRFWTPEQVAEVLRRGAFAVVIGTAITNPIEITRRFAAATRIRTRAGGGGA